LRLFFGEEQTLGNPRRDPDQIAIAVMPAKTGTQESRAAHFDA
jgi:hypothetical protein